MKNQNHELLLSISQRAKTASRQLALLTDTAKNAALNKMAAAIRQDKLKILAANAKDCEHAKSVNLPAAFCERLLLNDERIEAMAQSLETIAKLPDPVGRILEMIRRPNGLEIDRISVPLGVLGVIYEARPNVTTDAAGLALKSGNAIMLRCGSECFHSAMAIVAAIQQGLADSQIPAAAIQMIPTIDRDAVTEMLQMEDYIDVIIPRGGQELIKHVAANTRIPVLKHLSGLCHTYVHQDANLEMAIKILINAKMRRPGICGATEVMLIDRTIVTSHLNFILNALIEAGCEIRGDKEIVEREPRAKLATDNDFDTEFLAAIIAVKIVDDLTSAIAHITQHSTKHTDAIITENNEAAERFLDEIDSAIVMHNASTQFADGGEFGMGAEIGIATGKLHARGPVGANQLTTFKYVVQGTGQIRS